MSVLGPTPFAVILCKCSDQPQEPQAPGLFQAFSMSSGQAMTAPYLGLVKTNMAPIRGWCARGRRLAAKIPHGHWKTMTFLAALRCDRIEAPWVLDGPINGQSFRTYVDQVLAPTLKPGDVVILDNLGSHKGKAVRRAIRASGARLLFLPPYSPDLNPIEQVFAKLKHLMRKAKERTVDATWKRTGSLLS
jgi:transposase